MLTKYRKVILFNKNLKYQTQMAECPRCHSKDYDIIETTITSIKRYRCRADTTHIWQDPHKTD